MYLFERQSTAENLDHVPEFKTVIDKLVREAKKIVVIGWRWEDGSYGLFDYLQGTIKERIYLMEAWQPNLDRFERQGVIKLTGNAAAVCSYVPTEDWDSVFLWQDGPEHLCLLDAKRAVRDMIDIGQGVVLATPDPGGPYADQGALGGNPYEQHRSKWYPEDYRELGLDVASYSPGFIGYWARGGG